MKNKSEKSIKDDNIHFRVTSLQKEQITQKAEELGMPVSGFLLNLVEQDKIKIIDGKALAAEVYKLNRKLDLLEKYPAIPVQEIRDVVSQGIVDIIKASEEK